MTTLYSFRNETKIEKVYKIDKGIPEELSFPKLRFVNVKEVESLEEYGPSSKNYFFFFKPPHSLFYVQRLKITTYCPFNFNKVEIKRQGGSLLIIIQCTLPCLYLARVQLI